MRLLGRFPVARLAEIAEGALAEQSAVLLKNENGLLPLEKGKIHSIAVIGSHADMGMISGGGSAQVDPPGAHEPIWKSHVWFPTSPLKAVSAHAAGVRVQFNSGANPAEAAELARESDVALIFACQWASEDFDLPNLSLPENQDTLIERVATANPHTIVVLETGSAITMPWVTKVSGILEAWYAGSKGADAIANLLFGDANPSGKLPITFPRSEQDMPHPVITLPAPEQLHQNVMTKTGEAKPTFEVHYDEGLKVGYKWYDAERKEVLFPFGFGLSYTTFGYSGLKLASGNGVTVNFTVKNTGQRREIAEVYAALPQGSRKPPKRLVGWSKVSLEPGESREITIAIDPRFLSIYDEQADAWKLFPGEYTFLVGGSSQNFPLHDKIPLK